MVALNDTERITLLVQGKMQEALTVAKQNYTKIKSRRKKRNCSAEYCIIYPCDEEYGFDDKISCTCGAEYHIRCEEIMLIDDDQLPESYECKKCRFGDGNSEWLKETLNNGITIITRNNQQLSMNLTKIEMHIEKLEEVDSQCGNRQRLYKESCKNLKFNPAKYHGGDFEGKAIQDMLECARNEKYELLYCIKDKKETFDKFKRALDTLQQVSDIFKVPIDHFDDGEIKTVKNICEEWGKNWTIDFPHLNITPKGHNMIFVLPEILKQRRSFYMFYKMEERGESIHAELNNIQRKIWCIRDPEKRLWKYIERYKLRNILDKTIVEPENRVFKNKKINTPFFLLNIV